MIDPEARIELLGEHARDPDVAAMLLDVVIGPWLGPGPGRTLAPACRSAMADGGPQIVAYVLGTDQDPQGFAGQREALVQAGCIVTQTAARASLVAAAIATGDPRLARSHLSDPVSPPTRHGSRWSPTRPSPAVASSTPCRLPRH